MTRRRVTFLLVMTSLAFVLATDPGLVRADPGLSATKRLQGWVLNAPADSISGTATKWNVEVPGPPPPNTNPPFKVQVMINGWAIAEPVAVFNTETNNWEFSVVIPPGSSGGTLTVWIHPADPDVPSFSSSRSIK